jgi:peptide/nickel transport system ATP-binding protein
VVETLADRLAVMVRGRFVETGPPAAVLGAPLHPYTRRLVAAELRLDGPRRRGVATGAEPPGVPGACVYAAACPLAIEPCRTRVPVLERAGPDHLVACHRPGVPAP